MLAAGFSTRLARPKALARVRGMSLILGTVRLLAPLTATRIIVVIPPRSLRIHVELRGQRVTLAANRQRADGVSSSVRCGLRLARHSAAALLLPVDLTQLKRRDLERLLARWSGARRRVVATRFGRHAGTPLILPRWLFPRALGILGDRGLKALVNGLPPTDLALLNLASAAWDVDTPRDLDRARRRWPASGR